MNILFILLAIYVIYILLEYINYSYTFCNTNESFVDNYYDWDWSNKDIIKHMNIYSTENKCSTCMYSESCNLTDDAHPFCYNSYDIPSSYNNILVRNSF